MSECQPNNNKSVDELLKEKYLSAKDLMVIIPNLKIQQARNYINEIQNEMKEKKYYIPIVRPKLALTKLVKAKFGL